MKILKTTYWVTTVALSLLMLFSAGMYLFNYEMVKGMITSLGYSHQIIYPLAIAKILGVIAVIFRKQSLLKNLAYLGFFVDLVLAIIAHINVNDGQQGGAIIGLVLVLISFFTERKVFEK